jgi:hypothetical protein
MDPVVIPTGQRDLSIDESAARVPRESTVRFSGRLQSSNPKCVAGQSVVLQRSAPHADDFQAVEGSTTGKAGAYSITVPVSEAGRFRAVAPDAGACQEAISAVTFVSVSDA